MDHTYQFPMRIVRRVNAYQVVTFVIQQKKCWWMWRDAQRPEEERPSYTRGKYRGHFETLKEAKEGLKDWQIAVPPSDTVVWPITPEERELERDRASRERGIWL